MSTVKDILAIKGPKVVSVGPDATVFNAALVMNEHRIGALVVRRGDEVVGMFTERDVLQRVLAQQLDPAHTRVEEVMSREVVCCTPETPLDEVRSAFKNRRIRHLPVVDGERHLAGMVSIGDLNAYESAAQEQTIHLLHEYLYGRV
jgi:CBS domain-containing protein